MEQLSERRRRMNADRRRRFGASGRPLALICECADDACHRTVLLSPDEYDARLGPVVHVEHSVGPPTGPGPEPRLPA